MHDGVIPLGGGLALLAGTVLPVVLLADHLSHPMRAILVGACLCALVGFADDVYDLPVVAKFASQVGVAIVPVAAGVSIDHVTLPILSPFSTGIFQYPLTIIWIVGLMNVLNFVDGMDGLAAGVGAISAGTFCVLALSLGRVQPALIVAALAGACIGFLRRNFHPARVFMGDAGSMTIGFVLASVSVLGVLKTAAAVAVGFPLVVLFVPLLDTSFVIARRLKHGQAPWRADSGHLHHRFARIGWGQRQAALLLYAWCASLAGLALAIRFVHYRTHSSVHWGSSALLAALGLLALALHALRRVRARDPQAAPPPPRGTRAPQRGTGGDAARGREARAPRPCGDRSAESTHKDRPIVAAGHCAKRHLVPHGATIAAVLPPVTK